MNRSTNTERLVRIETKLCRAIEQHELETKAMQAELRKTSKMLEEQAKANQRLGKFLDEWETYQRQVRDGTITIE